MAVKIFLVVSVYHSWRLGWEECFVCRIIVKEYRLPGCSEAVFDISHFQGARRSLLCLAEHDTLFCLASFAQLFPILVIDIRIIRVAQKAQLQPPDNIKRILDAPTLFITIQLDRHGVILAVQAGDYNDRHDVF